MVAPLIAAAGITAGASLLGGMMGASGSRSQNAANAKQAALNREFQERMSSTAHQREVADLRAAGLNPILSATGGKGAATPGGAQANMVNTLEVAANSAVNMGNSIAQMSKNMADADATTENNFLIKLRNDAIREGLTSAKDAYTKHPTFSPKGTVFDAKMAGFEKLFENLSNKASSGYDQMMQALGKNSRNKKPINSNRDMFKNKNKNKSPEYRKQNR